MKVLIDFTQIPLQKAGAGVYAYWLVKEIDQLSQEKIFVLILDDEKCFEDLKNINLIRINSIFRFLFLRIFLEQLYIPFLEKKLKIEVVHSLHYSFPFLSRKKCIVTIHDMTFFLYPEVHVFSKKQYFRFFTKLACSYANKLISVSQSTKNDLIKKFPKAASKTTVIPLGHKFVLNFENTDIGNIIKKSLKEEYILFIGTIEPRKNILSIIKAFEKVKRSKVDLKLFICGRKGWYYDEIFEYCEKSNYSNDIIFTGFISEYEKHNLLSNARVFIYPSIYEGFGIPVLEALAYGIPTITSNLSSLPEVVGNAALLVDPLDIDEISNGIVKILNDFVFSNELKTKALNQSKKFTWELMAQSTLKLYSIKI